MTEQAILAVTVGCIQPDCVLSRTTEVFGIFPFLPFSSNSVASTTIYLPL